MLYEAPRVAIVSGASRGIGRATAIRLAKDFTAVVLVSRSEDELKHTANSIKSESNSETLILAADLWQPEAAEHVVPQTLDKFGRIDAVVNIAGAVLQATPFAMTEEQWDDGFALKLHGARHLTVKAWDALKESRGSVIFMSGNSALTPRLNFAAVATVSAAIVAFSKAMAEQGIADGIQVNAVLPGAVLTDRRYGYFKHWAKMNNTTPEEAMKIFPSKSGIERFGQPEEIASLIAFVLSPEAQWKRSSTLVMDGGEIKSV